MVADEPELAASLESTTGSDGGSDLAGDGYASVIASSDTSCAIARRVDADRTPRRNEDLLLNPQSVTKFKLTGKKLSKKTSEYSQKKCRLENVLC